MDGLEGALRDGENALCWGWLLLCALRQMEADEWLRCLLLGGKAKSDRCG